MSLSARAVAFPIVTVLLLGCPAESDTDDTDVSTEADTETGTEVDTEADTEVDTEADTEVDTEADTEVDTEADTEPDTEADTEPDTSEPMDTTYYPLNDFELYSSGCEDEIWGRWTNGTTFDLEAFVARNADNNTVFSETWFTPLTFVGGEQDTMLLIDAGSFSDTAGWSWGFDFSGVTDVLATATVADTLPPTTNHFSNVQASRIVELEINATADFNGSIQRMRYYTDAECWRQTNTFPSGSQTSFVAGQSFELPEVPDAIPSGVTYYITIEGWNEDAEYTFYDVVEVAVP